MTSSNSQNTLPKPTTSLTAILHSSHSSWPYWFKFNNNHLDCSVLLSEGEILNIFTAITSKTLLHKWTPTSHLTFFRDSFEYHSDSERVFLGFARMLENYPTQLKSLDITFENCNSLTNKELEILAHGISRHAGTLETFHCKLRKLLNITDSGLKTFVGIITKSVKRLKDFSLHLGISTKLTDKGVNAAILKVKSYLKDLKSLSIQVPTSGRLITDSTSQALAKGFGYKRFGNLKELTVDFSFCRYIGDHGLEILGEEIGRSLRSLERLECGFEGCFNVTDQGIGGFAAGIGKGLENIKSLGLNFGRCKEVTNQGIFPLMMWMKLYGKELECLALNFGCCNRIDNEGLKGVYTMFERGGFGKLREVKMSFSGCVRITGLGVNLFKSQMKRNLGNMVEVSLDLSNCGGFTGDEMEEERSFEHPGNSMPIPHIPDFDVRDVEFPDM